MQSVFGRHFKWKPVFREIGTEQTQGGNHCKGVCVSCTETGNDIKIA